MPKSRTRRTKQKPTSSNESGASDIESGTNAPELPLTSEQPALNNAEDSDNVNEDTMMEDDEDDVSEIENDIFSEDNESQNEQAAHVCRLPKKEVSSEELFALPFLTACTKGVKDSYIITRNYACLMWTEDPKIQVTVDRLEGFLVTQLTPEHLSVLYDAGLVTPICESTWLVMNETATSSPTSAQIKTALLPPHNWKAWSTPNAKSNLNRLAFIAVLFLERYGYINYGFFKCFSPPLTRASTPFPFGQNGGVGSPNSTPRTAAKRQIVKEGPIEGNATVSQRRIKVVIAGAGMAGLIAAQQLMYFGAEVIVLESRDRVGGRMWTYRNGDYHADLGAMVITGLSANPVAVLSRQLRAELKGLCTDCNIYAANGQLISRSQDSNVESEFNRLLGTAAYACHAKQLDLSISEPQLSLGYVLDRLIAYQEKHCRELKVAHHKLEGHLIKRRKKLNELIENSLDKIKFCHDKWKAAHDAAEARIKARKRELNPNNAEGEEESGAMEVPLDADEEYEIRRLQADHFAAWKEFEPLEMAHNRLKRQLEVLNQNRPREQYLTADERQLIGWHIANLEFANAAKLNELSLRHWDQDDMFELTGDHCVVENGYGSLAEALAEAGSSAEAESKMAIEFKTQVKRVSYDEKKVQLEVLNAVLSQDDLLTHEADAFLSTVPLGILKDSVEFEEASPKMSDVERARQLMRSNVIEFVPALPKQKVESIKRLGFGVLNKVILVFPHEFWDKNRDMFGHVNESWESRGELFFFWSVTDKPVLIALVAGQAAIDLEQKPNGAVAPIERSASNLLLPAATATSKKQSGTTFGAVARREPIVQRALAMLRSMFPGASGSQSKVPDASFVRIPHQLTSKKVLL